VLCKETHGTVIRLSPPLMVAREDLEFAVGALREVFAAGGIALRQTADGRRQEPQ
jgi:ornithine--oxo-acid transaminase